MKKFDRKFGKSYAETIPPSPGIYRFYSPEGELVYVGKAKNLRRRLGQYRNAQRCRKHQKMREIIGAADRLEYEVCRDHLSACLLENEWIQSRRPRFNVAGAFSFLYPMVGLRQERNVVEFCYTHSPEALPGFEYHGAYRSRSIVGDAFFSMMKLFSYLAHPENKGTGRRSGKGYVFAFRQFPQDTIANLAAFLRGEDRCFLEDLILKLVEKPGARWRAVEVQEHLTCVARFWRHEARVLRGVLVKTAFPLYPLPQRERDPLFIRYREGSGEIFSCKAPE